MFRPNRIAILHGDKLPVAGGDAHSHLIGLFSALEIDVISIAILGEGERRKKFENSHYDVIGIIGPVKDFQSVQKMLSGRKDRIVLAFVPKNHFKSAKDYSKISNAVVLCETRSKDWLPEIGQVVFHFFESLVLPSLLNIDIADVRNIARGIGVAFNEIDDSAPNIISRLPSVCLVARSAILHFSCADSVRLREIYSISKAIALKRGNGSSNRQIETHRDASKAIRKVNVKMGIRIRDEIQTAHGTYMDRMAIPKRISMTAILFGI